MSLLERLLDLLYPPRCAACGQRGVLVCDACLLRCRPLPPARRPRPLAPASPLLRAQAVFAFEEPLRSLVHALKYRGQRRLARPLAALLLPHQPWQPAALVPVPLHAERLRERGFNQAALLAAHLSAAWEIPLLDGLQRTRATAHQVGRHASERAANVQDAFVWVGPVLAPPTALLIDDVLTTGATLEACARALAAAGTAEIQGFALARAQA